MIDGQVGRSGRGADHALVFGGRRSGTMPLVHQSFNWAHGVYLAATMGSETTAAAFGIRAWSGATRSRCCRSPAITWPTTSTTGWHSGTIADPPRIFGVNWFRTDEDGNFVWPGFGENMRVLEWIVDRSRGRAYGLESPIGWMPRHADLDWTGLEDFTDKDFRKAMSIDRDDWDREILAHDELFIKLNDRIPREMVAIKDLTLSGALAFARALGDETRPT